MEITSIEASSRGRAGRWARLLALASAIGIAAALAGPPAADAQISTAEAQQRAEAGAAWFAHEQEASTGKLAGDWGMTALAAAGTNAADVRVGALAPSAQDFYVNEWATLGPGGVATDAERAVLAGSAGGIQTSRVAASRNLVAQIAGYWDGTQIGSKELLNDDIFGVLALDRVEAPQSMLEQVAGVIRARQLPNGGWSWSNGPNAIAEADMTGSAIGALCDAGADPQTDPAIQKGFAFLHTLQDQATGGFASPPFFPVNTDSTGWVASGLIACGIDPQSAEWTTALGATPFDYLASMQLADGRFCWQSTVTCEGSAAYATWDAVRPLAGDAWSAAAPEREDAAEPSIRPAPAVAAGTAVPIALMIDYGNGEADMCRIKVPSGADLDTALTAAQQTAIPAGCVDGAQVSAGGGGETLEQLNGVAPAAGSRWLVSVDNGPEEAKTSTPIAFGDMLSLRLEGTATRPIEPPALDPGSGGSTSPTAEQQRLDLPRARLGGAHRARVQGHWIKARVSCPAGLGPEGCTGTVTIRYKHAGKARTGGQSGFALGSGASRRVAVSVRPALRKLIAKSGRRSVSLVAATRSADGTVTLAQAGLRLLAPPSRGR